MEKGKKLIKHGNSWALVIDKPLLKALRIDPQTIEVEILIQDNQLVVKPISAEKTQTREEEIEEIALRIMEKYDPVFKKLSKN